VLVFFLLRAVIPTDTVDLMIASQGANDPEQAARLRQELGLTGSLPGQYLRWLGALVQGDFGTSLVSRQPVAAELGARLPVSIELGLGALVLTLLLGVPIGILSAARQDTWLDYGLRGGAIFAFSVPDFWAATLVLVGASMWFGWAPPLTYQPLWVDAPAHLGSMALPMLLLALAPIGSLARLVRTQVLEVTRQDFVRTARAKGLAPGPVYTRHVLRNALLPIATLVGLQLPRLVAGTVIFERIFGLPGVGRYLVDAVSRLDYPVILATNLVFGLALVLSNLVVDLSYAWIDPRIRLR
jgi:peptide/nickel transport system permease protein